MASSTTMGPTTTTSLLIALLVLVIISLVLAAALFFFRRHRQSKRILPLNSEDEKFQANKTHQRRLSGLILSTANFRRQAKPIFVYKGKAASEDGSPPASPLPEIRITFPDEVDESGKRNSGRVYLVRVGDQGTLGLEPMDDKLPSYQIEASERFQSLDLQRIGGLKEKLPPAVPAKQ